MPRISNSVLRRARAISRLLPLLLPTCRDIPSARNELRWLAEHAIEQTVSSGASWRALLRHLCAQRGRGKPLQYILGNQPFGGLEILCRKGVFIPRLVSRYHNYLDIFRLRFSDRWFRPETEAYTMHIADMVNDMLKTKLISKAALPSSNVPRFRILDLCSGTGCVSLLLHALLSRQELELEILGIDISPKAVALAKRNLSHNITLGNLPRAAKDQVRFAEADIFCEGFLEQGSWDMMISNPPYISPRSFNQDTARSTRSYEPKIALVPPCSQSLATKVETTSIDVSIGDSFYSRLSEVAERSNAKILLVEVADMAQARRIVAKCEERRYWYQFEIWRDWPDKGVMSETLIGKASVKVIGHGHGRSVLAWKDGKEKPPNDRRN